MEKNRTEKISVEKISTGKIIYGEKISDGKNYAESKSDEKKINLILLLI